jgi:hypothetical protein
MERKQNAADLDKLNAQIKRGNMAEIALQSSVSSYCARAKEQYLATLISLFKEGKTGMEMISIVAQLAAIGEIERELLSQVAMRDKAARRIGEIENEHASTIHREY